MSIYSCNNLFLVEYLLYINTHNLWAFVTGVGKLIQYKMLNSAPSLILSVPDKWCSRNSACALNVISTFLLYSELLCHQDICVDSFIICFRNHLLLYLFYCSILWLCWVLIFHIHITLLKKGFATLRFFFINFNR